MAGATGLEPATFGVTGRRSYDETNEINARFDSSAENSGSKAPRFDSSQQKVESQNADGRATSWTPERRAAQAARMRKCWRNGGLAKRRPATIGKAERAARSARMKALNLRMCHDDKLKNKCVCGQKRVRRSAAYRAVQSAVMKDIMASPELRRRARFHCIRINKNPKVRKKQWAGRRRKRGVQP